MVMNGYLQRLTLAYLLGLDFVTSNWDYQDHACQNCNCGPPKINK